jgi:shikimate dehydrogenase
MKQRNFGIIGYPLEHSFSKSFFEQRFAAEKIENVSYKNYPIENINLLPALLEKETNLCGFNVTIPYKEAVIPFLDKISPVAEEVGAVNVVKIDRNKDEIPYLTGYNTDVLGFEKSLLEQKQDYHNSALILGTGGAAKAVAYVLIKLNIAYQYVSRQPKSNALTYEMLDKQTIANNLLIINATPLGMFPNTDICPPIDYTAISEEHFLFDLVYNPKETLFLTNGKEHGTTVQNGYKMLCYQAEEAWRVWKNCKLFFSTETQSSQSITEENHTKSK